MQLEPKNLFEKLEFDKIIKLLENDCYGELGKAAIQRLKPDTDKVKIVRRLNEVREFKLSLTENDRFPVGNYLDISEDLRLLEIEGFVLPEEGLQRLNVILRLVNDMFTFFKPERQEMYPNLYNIIRNTTFDKSLMAAIEKVIDEEGTIRPDASPQLSRIRRSIGAKQKEMERVFSRMINDYRSRGWLTDNVESFRNGRRVLSVPAEHKRKIRGIIHDESTTGKTAFIEPEEVIEINNDIFDLLTEEKREIYRILKELSATLRPYVPQLRHYLELVARFDFIQAKARLAVQLNAQMPKVINKPRLGIEMGYHPLLLLKNKQLGRETVPFDLTLFGENRILMLSGPNAGGKSILLKSVGLLQVMLQSGLLIPVDEISQFGIFHNIFADIGDQQSLEDDLSTYSSHLKNMRTFLEGANDRTLVLIDEFGSGTDPKIGGAIAEAILNELNEKKVSGVITTHYSNLKIYAFKTTGILNGSMLFDKDNLAPTYQMKVGRPGSSFAFEIAQKTGLNKKILNYAQHRTGANEKAVDQLLVDLQQEKQELEEKLLQAIEREQKLEKLIRNYETLHRDLEFKRKKVKLEAKEQSLQQSARDNKEIERLIREIKEEKNLEKAKELAARVREEREQLAEEVMELREKVYNEPALVSSKKGPIEVGNYVRLRSGGATGLVEAVEKNTAIVQVGMLRMTVKLRDLEHAKAPLDVQSSRSVQMDTVANTATFESKIDIRGMRMEEAVKVVEDFVDQALMSSANHLRIVHGKGNGVLRNAVKAKLREYGAIKSVTHPEEEFGGDGVTLVELG